MSCICRMCKRPHSRLTPTCGTCVKVQAAHREEVLRQETRLMLRGMLPRLMTHPPIAPIVVTRG